MWRWAYACTQKSLSLSIHRNKFSSVNYDQKWKTCANNEPCSIYSYEGAVMGTCMLLLIIFVVERRKKFEIIGGENVEELIKSPCTHEVHIVDKHVYF